jgi:hypothetical protein
MRCEGDRECYVRKDVNGDYRSIVQGTILAFVWRERAHENFSHDSS